MVLVKLVGAGEQLVALGWEQSLAAFSICCDVVLHFACRGKIWDADCKNLPSEPVRSMQPQDMPAYSYKMKTSMGPAWT